MTKEPVYWGTVRARKVDKFRETLEGLLNDGGDLQGLWLKVKGWYIEKTNGSERELEHWESISGCLTYKNVEAVKGLIKYVTYGTQGYIIIGKVDKFDNSCNINYQPGGIWSHQPCADLIKSALEHKRVLKT
jgi:hypothetical protein